MMCMSILWLDRGGLETEVQEHMALLCELVEEKS